jgi:hypothetical protein
MPMCHGTRLSDRLKSFRGVRLRAEAGQADFIGFSFLTIWQNLSVHVSVLGVLEDLPLENKGNRERH